MRQTMNLDDLIAEYETELADQAKSEMLAEQAEWDALPKDEQAAILAAKEAQRDAEREEMLAKGVMVEGGDEPDDEDEDEQDDEETEE